MRAYFACLHRELLTRIRSGRLLILTLLFVGLGIMNPAIAKLTPWLLETLSDSMTQSGMTVTVGQVSAMDSWVQFFKNAPMALIALTLLEGGILTDEIKSGTLLLSLTKGLRRSTVVCAKASVLSLTWTVGYFLCFGITYAYNGYFWDNSVAKHLILATVAWWLFGMLICAVMLLLSVCASSLGTVLLGTGAAVSLNFFLGMIPKIAAYLPTRLTDANALIYGLAAPDAYTAALAITATLTLLCFLLSLPLMNRRSL